MNSSPDAQTPAESGSNRFEDLIKEPAVLQAVQNLGFESATPVQQLTIPKAVEKGDLIVEAKTGSGKTYAFGIPIAVRIIRELGEKKPDYPYALILSPTRELALQIGDALSVLIEGLEPCLLIGGMPAGKQKAALKKDPRVVIGTPGRILDFMDQRVLDLGDCNMFVLDEVDEMLSMGFIEDVSDILAEIPKKAQGLFVSATVSDAVKNLSRTFLQDPEVVDATTIDEAPADIDHLFCNVGSEMTDKPAALCDLVEMLNPKSTIVFCNTRSETEVAEVFLRRRGFDARRLNSDLNQRQRIRIMNKIRDGELRILIATDIAARGIDIAQIELVVNLSLNRQPESYMHRTGRTGRAGRHGKAISLVSPHDFMAFEAIKKEFEVPFEKIELPEQIEIARLRLENLKKNLGANTDDLKEQDVVLARLALQEIGGISETTPEFEQFFTRLVQFSTSHFVSQKVLSLEEELAAEEKARSQSSKGGQRDSHKGGHRKKGGKRNYKGKKGSSRGNNKR